MARSQDISIRPSDIHPVLNFVGCSQYAKDPIFKGCIDDLRIYDYALDTDEIVSVMGDTDSVADMSSDYPTVTESSYYSSDGVLLPGPKKGLNIVKDHFSDGKTRNHKIIRQ